MCVTDSKPCGEWPYDNTVCPICGHGIMTCVACRLHEAAIHMEHCHGCEYNQGGHCMYYMKMQEQNRKPPRPRWKDLLDDWRKRNS